MRSEEGRGAAIDSAEVRDILERVRRRYGRDAAGGAAPPPAAAPTVTARGGGAAPAAGDGIFATIPEAVEAAWTAFRSYRAMGLDRRHEVIESIRGEMRRLARELAQKAHQETGLGRTEDKVLKNRLVIEKTPGPEDLEPDVWTGDRGLTITEYAPFGVIAAITPTTNPTATVINNTISALSAGNAVVFNVHPNAKRVSVDTVRAIDRAVVAAGGPPNLVATIPEPTIESAHELMEHPRARILLVTGGPGVVQAALATKKRAITAGPGNPPVVVDQPADLELAGREIVRGGSFDNNVICTDEKEVFAVEAIADRLLEAMRAHHAVVVPRDKLEALERVIFKQLGAPGKPGKIDPRWIGKNAGVILAEIGIVAGDEVRLAVVDVPVEHPLVWTEQMMPVMPVARVPNVDRAIELAVKAEHGFGHTASIYSRDVDAITRMARAIDVSIFVANAANLAGLGEGGEGYTSYSIASPTGEGLTRPRTLSRIRRLTVAGGLRIV
jgi:acyl-CoA reductase-like NAD-dependent aldehyde dehydrogenase